MNEWREDTIGEWLAKRLGRDDVPEPLWRWLKEGHYVSTVLNEEDPKARFRSRDDLLGAARRQLAFLREMGSSSAKQDSETRGHVELREAVLPPDDPVVARAKALSLYWAKLAAANRDVERFREEALEGHTISAAEASTLVRSPAASVLPLTEFKRESIPIVDHGAKLLWVEESAPFERPYRVHGELKITWAEGEKQRPFNRRVSNPLRSLPFWDGEKEHLVRAWRGSALADLHAVATKLTQTYPWKPSIAAWFVLTNEPPWVPPLTAHASGPDTRLNHGSITITAAHWVPKEAVSRFYADVKGRMNPAPTPSMRRLRLFRFVVQHSEGIWEPYTVGLNLPSWRPLLRLWNEEYPVGHSWHYHDVRNFRRDYQEAFNSLANAFRG